MFFGCVILIRDGLGGGRRHQIPSHHTVGGLLASHAIPIGFFAVIQPPPCRLDNIYYQRIAHHHQARHIRPHPPHELHREDPRAGEFDHQRLRLASVMMSGRSERAVEQTLRMPSQRAAR
ncbi:MAG: hypothetical protein U0Q16_16715 [Bryobacteraceae bacterium]